MEFVGDRVHVGTHKGVGQEQDAINGEYFLELFDHISESDHDATYGT